MSERHVSVDELAEAVRWARRFGGLSYRDVEDVAGVPASTVSRIEKRQHEPSLPTLRQVAAWLGVDIVIPANGGRPHGG